MSFLVEAAAESRDETARVSQSSQAISQLSEAIKEGDILRASFFIQHPLVDAYELFFLGEKSGKPPFFEALKILLDQKQDRALQDKVFNILMFALVRVRDLGKKVEVFDKPVNFSHVHPSFTSVSPLTLTILMKRFDLAQNFLLFGASPLRIFEQSEDLFFMDERSKFKKISSEGELSPYKILCLLRQKLPFCKELELLLLNLKRPYLSLNPGLKASIEAKLFAIKQTMSLSQKKDYIDPLQELRSLLGPLHALQERSPLKASKERLKIIPLFTERNSLEENILHKIYAYSLIFIAEGTKTQIPKFSRSLKKPPTQVACMSALDFLQASCEISNILGGFGARISFVWSRFLATPPDRTR